MTDQLNETGIEAATIAAHNVCNYAVHMYEARKVARAAITAYLDCVGESGGANLTAAYMTGFERGKDAAPTPETREPSEEAISDWVRVETIDEMESFYHSRLPAIREVAREHGYAIGVHGSARRDFDLIAVPWRDGSSDKDALAHAIAKAACGLSRSGSYHWEEKPAGRYAVSMPICWTAWHDMISAGHIDLSVMPPVTSTAPKAPSAEGWQTIESAPKDGTEVLLSGYLYGDPAQDRWQAVAGWSAVLSDWLTDDEDPDSTLNPATHWMPLPPTPPMKGEKP